MNAAISVARQRLLTALEHQPPARVPFSFNFGPTPEMHAVLEAWFRPQGIDWRRLQRAADDKVTVHPDGLGENAGIFGGELNYKLLGVRTKKVRYHGGEYAEFADFALAGMESVAEIERHPWPTGEEFNFDGLRARILDATENRRKGTQIFAGNPLEIYTWMTGLEEVMENLLLNPALVRAAFEKINAFWETKLIRTLETAGDLVDIVYLGDDLGGQEGLLFSRETYRALLQPYHKRLTAIARRLAPHAKCMFHSDGAVFDILPDLIDAGVEVLEAVQTDALGMDPSRLKATYGKDLSFHGAISVQALLPRGSVEEVERETRRMIEVLGAGGGYIAAPAHAIQYGTPPENVLAMLRAVLGEDLPAALGEAKIL